MMQFLSRLISVIVLVCILLVNSCSYFHTTQLRSGKLYDQIYRDKGYDKVMNRLEPKIFKPDFTIWALTGIDIQNKVASMDEKGDFCFLELSNNGNLSLYPIIEGFPRNDTGMDIHADKNIIWQVLNGGIDILDIDKKVKSDISARATEWQTFIADYEKKVMFIKIHEDENVLKEEAPVYEHYFLYNFVQVKTIFTSSKIELRIGRKFDLDYFSLGVQLLVDKQIFKNKRVDKHEWYLSDLYSKKIQKNKLTKTLTSLQISKLIKVNIAKRKMFVYSDANGFYYIINWDEHMKDVRYTMLRFSSKIIAHGMSSSRFDAVDNDFNWFVGYIKDSNMLVRNPVELVAFRIDDSLPAGISGPIKCGFFHPSSRGTFMNHEKWGPCYLVIENYKDENNILYVFTLEEGLKLIRK